jgi:hypothetical protein
MDVIHESVYKNWRQYRNEAVDAWDSHIHHQKLAAEALADSEAARLAMSQCEDWLDANHPEWREKP